MKAEVQKPSIFSRALSVLTYNWGLKLLALLLAILVTIDAIFFTEAV